MGEIDGLPAGLLSGGAMALAVDRFDRPGEGKRLHMEDAGQVVGAVGERKYTMATYETILNMIRRFSTDWRADVLEGIRRIVADVLIGNGDNHLKNWSFLFPGSCANSPFCRTCCRHHLGNLGAPDHAVVGRWSSAADASLRTPIGIARAE